MTTENLTIAGLVAVLVSLLLEWFPGLNAQWEPLSESQKRGLMALAVAVITVISVAINCWYYKVCPADWLESLKVIALTFILAAAGQQGVFALLKRSS